MTETFNRRTDNLMGFCLSLTGGLTSVGVRVRLAVLTILAVIFSAYRVAYKPADKAASRCLKSDTSICLVISMRQVMLKSPDVWMNSKEFDSNADFLYNPQETGIYRASPRH